MQTLTQLADAAFENAWQELGIHQHIIAHCKEPSEIAQWGWRAALAWQQMQSPATEQSGEPVARDVLMALAKSVEYVRISGGYAVLSEEQLSQIVDAHATQPPAVPDAMRSVANILVDVVPGEDGMGQEVYAKSVDDVVNLISKLAGEVDELELQRDEARAKRDQMQQDYDAQALALKAAKAMQQSETARADRAEAQRDQLLAALSGLLEDIDGLIEGSDGVAGLHQNGDIAPWSDLEPGGKFERLSYLRDAYTAIAAAKEQS
ncbi:hypothetical protein DK842_17760 [Chromobacterium phragmitis]|uniref:hypothetical protein n=1 Tax=Chromobacterium phragmitis TaxID=2202141 RepID=UPI000DEC7DA2|nr:hypothetical protein [Chromobacterium phragmitis]AXE31583.1 hypothetical protein DK842_17760 [Chromobacterium phragmitis]